MPQPGFSTASLFPEPAAPGAPPHVAPAVVLLTPPTSTIGPAPRPAAAARTPLPAMEATPVAVNPGVVRDDSRPKPLWFPRGDEPGLRVSADPVTLAVTYPDYTLSPRQPSPVPEVWPEIVFPPPEPIWPLVVPFLVAVGLIAHVTVSVIAVP